MPRAKPPNARPPLKIEFGEGVRVKRAEVRLCDGCERELPDRRPCICKAVKAN
jgi:hypothetical protein